MLPKPHNFLGFSPPLDNPPMVNVAKAGRAVPVKFSLDGYYGRDILEAGYPKSQGIDCDSLDPVDIVDGTVTTGATGSNNKSTEVDAKRFRMGFNSNLKTGKKLGARQGRYIGEISGMFGFVLGVNPQCLKKYTAS